jgi:hypothetical protein
VEATVGERVRCDVEDAHHERALAGRQGAGRRREVRRCAAPGRDRGLDRAAQQIGERCAPDPPRRVGEPVRDRLDHQALTVEAVDPAGGGHLLGDLPGTDEPGDHELGGAALGDESGVDHPDERARDGHGELPSVGTGGRPPA